MRCEGYSTTPEEHIEDIKNRYLSADKEFVRASLNKSIDRIEKAFPRYGSFLMEFIQNADDEESSLLIIDILADTIRINNNGLPFSKANVDSICKVGGSSKTPANYIGYLGVGFKSVFLISDSPRIYSGDYRFKFERDAFPEPDLTPWQIVPLWIDKPSMELPEGCKTCFEIPIKNPTILGTLKEEISPELITNRMLLFLRSLRSIDIRDETSHTSRTIKKLNLKRTEEYEIYLIQELLDGKLTSEDYWLVFRDTYEIPESVRQDQTTKDWERDGLTKREVAVAFRLDQDENLTIEEKGTAYIGVFSFLPLKEVPSGLNFLIQADFLTTPGRGELARDSLWNEWLAKEIYQLITRKVIQSFVKSQKWQGNFTDILYSRWGGHELFEDNIKRPLRSYIENEACLVADDGSIVRPSEAVIIDEQQGKLVNDEDLKTLYPNKKRLGKKTKIPMEVGVRTKRGPSFNTSSGVDADMLKLIQLNAKKRNLAFFENLYQELMQYAESTLRNGPFKYQNIIPTDEWELTDARTAYIKPADVLVPIELKGNFKLVHPDLASNPTVRPFLKILGVEELTSVHIQNMIRTREVPLVSKNWGVLSDADRIQKVGQFKQLWLQKRIDVRDLSFVTLRAKSGKWLRPDQLILPMEYQPDHRIESLKEKGLFDLPIEFLSAEFLEKSGDNDIRNWTDFFQSLGVDKMVHDRNTRKDIVSRVATLTALKFEEKRGRRARELSRTEETGGFDIVQTFQEDPDEGYGFLESQERYIEVKGSSKSNPDMFLTTRQFSTLREKRENYFVYVVRDSLRYPTLNVTRGDVLLKITDIKAIIPYSRWWTEAREDEFQP